MASRRGFAAMLAFSLILNAFCVPVDRLRRRRDFIDNEVDPASNTKDKATLVPITNISTGPSKGIMLENRNGAPPSSETITEIFGSPNAPPPAYVEEQTVVESPQNDEVKVIDIPLDDDDDDDDFDDFEPAPTTNGGSNLFSLLNLANGLFSGSNNAWLRNTIRDLILYNLNPTSLSFLRRYDVGDNEIELDSKESKPTFLRLETEENSQSTEESDTEESEDKDEENSKEEHNSSNDDNDAAEESVESIESNKNSKQVSESNGDAGAASNSEHDSDEPPGGGDGQGGGVLGILAGLSGGEDGSDLGSLLATVGGIVANLSGDGFDLNSLISSGLGLFVGLLSEGNENPGGVVASYLLTSLDTLTGGGAQNNGAFFGTFLSKLLKGTSAAGDGGDSDEEGDEGRGSDSAGFFASLLMGLLGNMSSGSSSNH